MDNLRDTTDRYKIWVRDNIIGLCVYFSFYKDCTAELADVIMLIVHVLSRALI
jgi:hypothetical protein